MIKHLVLFFSLLFSYSTIAEETARLYISDFSTEQLKGWKSKEFEGTTDYQIIQLDGKTVLKAESDARASGLYKEQRIDLYKTPYLNWSWRIENRLENLNEPWAFPFKSKMTRKSLEKPCFNER